MPLRTAAIALALALGACAPASETSVAAPPPSLDPALATATFDSAWSRIHNSYYDTTFKGLDWGAVRDELRPRAAAAHDEAELRRVLAEMLERLGDSHFAIIPRQVVDALDPGQPHGSADGEPGDAGLELRFVDGALLVTRVEARGAAAAAGVRPGWAVDAIDEHEVAEWQRRIDAVDGEVERNALRDRVLGLAARLLTGPSGSSVAVRFRDGADRPVTLRLERLAQRGEPVRVGNLPVFRVFLEHERLARNTGCVGLIRFNVWMTAINLPFENAMHELADCAGIVIDLRGNPGGIGGLVMGTAGYFVDEVVPLGIMKTRQSELRFVSNPRRVGSGGGAAAPFAGPVAILVDGRSASTSEIFAAGMQAIGRARLFGETTAGQALPALMLRLPNQDVLYHAIADFTDPHGVRLEGHGATPDVHVPLTRAGLLAGRDAPLEAALAWIAAQPAR